MREAVRSGRRTNFFITENRFIDCYAAKVGGSGVAVYSILQRCANSETKETFISADRMAEVLDIDRSTVYRKLKELENLRLIKSMRTREKTIYIVLQVPPPRPEAGPTPLFDTIDFTTSDQDQDLTWPPVAPEGMGLTNEIDSHECNASVAPVTQPVAPAQTVGRTGKNCNKEEQDLFNKTQEQDSKAGKFLEQEKREIKENAQRILSILGLPSNFLIAAMAAVEAKVKQKLSMDGIVPRIATDARVAERMGVSNEKFLEGFLARTCAEEILDNLSLPVTNSLISTVTAAVKAEVKDTGLSVPDVGARITSAAIKDRGRGTSIDRFYFENVKWRSNVRSSKAEQRKLNNLEVNARVKQRLREKFGHS